LKVTVLPTEEPAVKILAIISEKGGAGKTTLAVNLAVAAEAAGLATAIFDLDPRANSTVWGDTRDSKIPEVVPAQAPRLAILLRQARDNEAALVIIDTAGNAETTAGKAAEAADAILIPCRPFGPDLISIATSAKLAQSAGKPFYVVINAAPVQGVETEEAIAAITGAGVKVSPVVVHNRKAFVSRFHEGMAALDIEPNGKAAGEIRELLAWLCGNVILLPREQSAKIAK
jgi:chromosome partitioning protein